MKTAKTALKLLKASGEGIISLVLKQLAAKRGMGPATESGVWPEMLQLVEL